MHVVVIGNSSRHGNYHTYVTCFTVTILSAIKPGMFRENANDARVVEPRFGRTDHMKVG